MNTQEKIMLSCLVVMFIGFNLIDIREIVKNKLSARIYTGQMFGIIISILIVVLGCWCKK